MFAGRVKIISHSSCRKSAILKYFCPLGLLSFFFISCQSQHSYLYKAVLCSWGATLLTLCMLGNCRQPFRRKARGHHKYSAFRPSFHLVPCVGNSSFSFLPVHGLKMCILFGYNLGIIFCHFFVEFSLFYGQNEWIQGILCWRLLLQFYANSFETLQVQHVCRSWSEAEHSICILLKIIKGPNF